VLRARVAFGALTALGASACFPSFDGLSGESVSSDAGGELSDSAGAAGSAQNVDGSPLDADRVDTGFAGDVSDANAASDSDAATCVADLSSDIHNCGRCGRDCLSGGCDQGECQPFVFVQGVDAREIAQDYEHLFWVTKGDNASVYMINHDGSNKSVLATGQNNPCGMLPTDRRLHWANQGVSMGANKFAPNTGSIWNTDLQGSNDTHVLANENDPMFLATDGNTVWWTAHGTNSDPEAGKPDGAIRSCARTPCTAASATTVVTDFFGPLQIAFAKNVLYWTTERAAQDSGRGSVWSLKVNPAGIPDRVTAMNLAAAYDVALQSDGNFLFYTSTDLGSVTRTATGAGAGGFLSNLLSPREIVAGADFVYWINRGSSLMRLPLAAFKSDGTAPTQLKTYIEPQAGDSIALHDQPGPGKTPALVYFVSGTDIMKMVK
jgi:hypothetical protein